MDRAEPDFKQRVEAIVAQIPAGRVMTYGQLAALCGNARVARIVGGIAHFGDPELPWQQVVNKQGGLAAGYPGGRQAHAQHLAVEGIEITDNHYVVNMSDRLWWPNKDPSTLAPPPSPLLVIIGETASGKSAAAIELARRFDGEIIGADSWTVYREFNIGTAKPSAAERTEIPHHLFDIVDAPDGFNAALFKKLANASIADIQSRGKLPILVGGTGLYIDSVVFDFEFMPPGDPGERERRNDMIIDDLLAEAEAEGVGLEGVDIRNKRRIIRALETDGMQPKSSELPENTAIIGIATAREDLKERITKRVDSMLNSGLETEVQILASKYGWDVEPMKGIGYREWREYFDGSQTLASTRERIISSTMKLAKRQRTWFKRNSGIQWIHNRDQIVDIATTLLNKND